jgi:spermidine synthase
MSAGGAGGGLFVGLIAPYVFPAYWELPIGIIACLIATFAVFFRDKKSWLYRGQPRPAWLAIGLWISILAWSLQGHAREGIQSAIDVSRNFYGVLRVEDDPETNRRDMFHGSILHGTQFLDAEREQLPTTYYGRKSGVGLTLEKHRPRRKRRIGIVGLGVGTLATYGKHHDMMRLYEINPEVVRLAETHFTFLDETDAETEIILGDARLSMEYEAPQNYDILVLDAFSGDAIPTHLLTKESAEVYARHLRDDGILCFHISNLHFDLRPVVLGLAKHLKMHAQCVRASENKSAGTSLCYWMLLSRKPIPTDILDSAEKVTTLPAQGILWTDDWSNLLSVLR